MVSGLEGDADAADTAAVPAGRCRISPPASNSIIAIRPPSSRKYTIEAKGASDALLVLFEDIDGEPRYPGRGRRQRRRARRASISLQALSRAGATLRGLRLALPGPDRARRR